MPTNARTEAERERQQLDNELAKLRHADPDYLPFSWLKQAAAATHKQNNSSWAPSREKRLPRGESN